MPRDHHAARARAPRTDFARTDWRRKGRRIAVTVNAGSREELQQYHLLLTKLLDAGRTRLLDAIQHGDVSLVDVRKRYEAEGLFGLAGFEDEVRLGQNLWTTLTEAARVLGTSQETRRRYQASAVKLRATGVLGPKATVGDLRRVDWRRLRPQWLGQHGAPSSAADWNHLGRLVSAMLTDLFGGKRTGRGHPFRAAVLDAFPFEKERPRKVTITLAAFEQLVTRLPVPLRAPILTLAVTGIRLGEYLSLTEASLEPDVPGIRVVGKTGPGVVPVNKTLWPVVRSAVPPRYRAGALRDALQVAAAAVGHPGLRLHDLRHLAAHAALSHGADISEVRALLRHSTAQQTMDYLTGASSAAASDALARAFAPTLQVINGGSV